MDNTILEVKDLDTYYGESRILRNINLTLKKGSITTIMGRNGVGKTTLLKSIIGLLNPKKGEITYHGKDITKLPTNARAKSGIGLVPQGREIFPKLTVYENLKLGLQARTDGVKKIPEDEVYELFPVLGQMSKRLGGNLSGGQQQQLAIARALIGKPQVLMLDEPTEGIQPSIINDIETVLKKLKNSGEYSILLVEQSLDFAKEVSDHYYVLDRGTVVLAGSASEVGNEQIKGYLAF